MVTHLMYKIKEIDSLGDGQCGLWMKSTISILTFTLFVPKWLTPKKHTGSHILPVSCINFLFLGWYYTLNHTPFGREQTFLGFTWYGFVFHVFLFFSLKIVQTSVFKWLLFNVWSFCLATYRNTFHCGSVFTVKF